MGCDRQKAKQRKVVKDLKYLIPDTDYEALRREFKTSSKSDDEQGNYDKYDAPPVTDEWDEDDWKPSR